MSPAAWTRFLLRVAWALAVLGVIAGSILPPGSAPLRILGIILPLKDKALHAIGYSVLVFLPVLHEHRQFALAAALGALALGVGIEFIQPYWGRSYEVGDMIADGVGICIGAAAALPIRSSAWMRRLKG
jgi:VanZ family protein